MKNKFVYRMVPQWKTAYKITEDCCYEKVVFEGKEIGVAGKMDKEGLLIGILVCCICDPKLEILPITAADYNAIVREVNKKRAA